MNEKKELSRRQANESTKKTNVLMIALWIHFCVLSSFVYARRLTHYLIAGQRDIFVRFMLKGSCHDMP